METPLIQKIDHGTAKITVVGMGYVGLPLALTFAEAGFEVFGFDTNEARVAQLLAGDSYILDVAPERIERSVGSGKFRPTTSETCHGESDVIIVCVPTPLTKTKDPDLRFVKNAGKRIAKRLRRHQLVILESTTYPGTTEELLLPLLESAEPKGGGELKVGLDFYLAFSPERIDPGSSHHSFREVPKVVGGVTAECTRRAGLLYSKVVDRVVPVSCTRVAEMAKLLENIFRSVNIALVNELMLLCDRMRIDVWEVIEAAATKPFGFMRFMPGPGLGGHCIPIDPFYLSWKAKEYDFNTKFIELSGEVNRMMPPYVVSKIADALNSHRKSISGSTILLLGLAYKPDVNDARESPSLTVAELLLKKNANLIVNDPHVVEAHLNGYRLQSEPFSEALVREADCVVLMTNHGAYNYPEIARHARLIVDTRNAFAGYQGDNIVKL